MPDPEGNSQLRNSERTQPYERHAELANVVTVLQMGFVLIKCKYAPCGYPFWASVKRFRVVKNHQTANDKMQKGQGATTRDLTGQRQNLNSPAGYAAWQKADGQRAGVQFRGKCNFKGECKFR